MSSTAAIVAIVVLALAVVAIVAAVVSRHRRTEALRQRFGPEYERALDERHSRSAAERELQQRERRHAELQLRELDPQQRQRYAEQWERMQAHFVEEPEAATREADELVTKVMGERGYPVEDFDTRVQDLSVDHAETLGHYRDAHEINKVNERGQASTEQLRQALMHYRLLFAELLGDASGGRPTPRHG
ncbi:hypothetical protein Daura_32465 [Dactylosporangium aurantiacum]|uniref:Secreted protein n=1 Tax=Dactylosporangium aurantiacum TaxID=35754 RepID=A0A9Q9I834_9ACTN|nr:hypothetical protein [Dactylosporangium aurantiacum]MDG6107155.1 hypothetical protein [Dactylosporangium aurantiacum]UWZ51449.1 hypothetical protein Daura_32465 [Dactylosporangium aurantiacum]